MTSMRQELANLNKHYRRYSERNGEGVLWYEFAGQKSSADDVFDEGGRKYEPAIGMQCLWVTETEDPEVDSREGRRPTSTIRGAFSVQVARQSGLSDPIEYTRHLNDILLYNRKFFSIGSYEIQGRVHRQDVIIGFTGIQIYPDEDMVYDLLPDLAEPGDTSRPDTYVDAEEELWNYPSPAHKYHDLVGALHTANVIGTGFVFAGTPSLDFVYANGTPMTGAVTSVGSAGIPGEFGSWEDMFNDTGLTLAKADAWYANNTGYLAEGFDEADLWGPGSASTVIINSAWLTANQGPNVVLSGGVWTVTGLHAKSIFLGASNVTLRHCYVERAGQVPGHGIEVHDYTANSSDNVMITNLRVEYCTLDGGNTNGVPDLNDYGDAFYYNPHSSLRNADGMVFSHCETMGYRTGFKINYATTVEYCWVHNLYIVNLEDHNTAASVRGLNTTVRRSYLADGDSSAISFYADNFQYTDIYCHENILATPNAIFEVNFPLRGTGWSPPEPTDVRELVGNKFERGTASDLQYFTVVNGNMLLDGTPLFGGGGELVSGQPSVVVTAENPFGPVDTIDTNNFNPLPNSTYLAWMVAGNAGLDSTHNHSLIASGMTWTKIAETAEEYESGNLSTYRIRGSLWKAETGASPPAFTKVTIDPYSNTDVSYMGVYVHVIPDVTGLTVAQAAVPSGTHNPTFGGVVTSINTGTLGVPATDGHTSMLFVGLRSQGTEVLDTPAQWGFLAQSTRVPVRGGTFWSDGFTDDSVTVALPAQTGAAVTLLVEFNL
jgi:hypothetical protein